MWKITVLALLLSAASPLHSVTPDEAPRPEEPFPYTAAAIGGFTALALGIGGFLWVARNRPRRCPGCRSTMERLGRAAHDPYLSSSEKIEESFRSAEYDVWLCPACGTSRKSRYGTWITHYSTCRRCGAKTVSKRTLTLSVASYKMEGRQQTTETCASCGYQKTSVLWSPRRRMTDSSSFYTSSW